MPESHPPQLTDLEELKITGGPLVAAVAGRVFEHVNDHIHSFREGPFGQFNPAEYAGNVWWSVLIGGAAYAAAATAERSHTALRTSVASVALAASCGIGAGYAVNAVWETDFGAKHVTSNIPRNIPLINQLNSERHTPNALDLLAGTLVSTITAAGMATHRQYYLRRKRNQITL